MSREAASPFSPLTLGPLTLRNRALKAIKESGVKLGRRIRIFFGTSEDGAGGDKKPKLKLGESEKSVTDKDPAKPEKPAKGKPTTSLLSSSKPDLKKKGFLTTDYIIEGDTEVSIEITQEAKP